MKSGLIMELEKGLLEKLFTEHGHVEGFERTDDLQEGVITNVTFTSEVKGEGDMFPSGEDRGSGTMTRRADGTVEAITKGSLVTDDQGHQFMWQSYEMSIVDGKKLKGLDIVTGSIKSQKWNQLNKLIIVLETKHSPSFKEFDNTGYGYKWK
jgi:hypothetical protein